MKKNRLTYIKNILFPCLLFSIITGIFTGVLIFLFKVASSWICLMPQEVYSYVSKHPLEIPLLTAIAALLGLAAALILKFCQDCRGGGIPTSIAILRGFIDFSWIKSIFGLFASSMLTFLCGVPLGTEGPSVQMGTAVGRGTVRVFAKNNPAWDRYIMTGGACAGFACATGAPLSGIFFAFEEAHRRFSPMIFMIASMTVISSMTVMNILCDIFAVEISLFGFYTDLILPLKYIWTAIIVGVACGVCAIVFTKLYKTIGNFIKTKLQKIPFILKTVIVFAAVCLFGVVSVDCIGTGHSLIHNIMYGHGIWYILILYLCVRSILLIIANQVGVTGGLFVPTLAFGALTGALCAQGLIYLGILPQKYFIIIVITGIASFLSASSRTPITAVTFAIEALCGLGNFLPIATGVTVAFLMIETASVPSFQETVVEAKAKQQHEGKSAYIVNMHLTVMPGSFAVGKEIRDILWPPTCTVLSVHKNSVPGEPGISEGDVLHVHYQTFDNERSVQMLEALVGKQPSKSDMHSHIGGINHEVPEI